MHKEIRISVRNLVEFILRRGDINSGFESSVRAVEGTRAHQKIQGESENYTSEVPMKYTFSYMDFSITVEGRADGIIKDDSRITIDEIKTTLMQLELIDEDFSILHWAQAKCYAFFYTEENNIEDINVQLTYYNIDTNQIKRIKRNFKAENLKKFFFDVIDKYIEFAEFMYEFNEKRDTSIDNLKFPFESYRKGQRELAVYVYRTIQNKKKLFINAPTGIGKTMSTAFPSIKALRSGFTSKIFYLTARTVTRTAAENALRILKGKGLELKSVTLTAKEKICFKDEVKCTPDYCPYAKGHYDRINDALLDILKNESIIGRESIQKYAEIHKVCPFEFSLDLTLWCDFIICDYNYVFDPKVYLRRFFGEGSGDYSFLIDEAHNLVDRSREMFSAQLSKRETLDLKKETSKAESMISKSFGKLNSEFLKLKKQLIDESLVVLDDVPQSFMLQVRRLIEVLEKWLLLNKSGSLHDKILDFYFNLLSFVRIAEFLDERYIIYVLKENDDFVLRLFCIDSSYLLSKALERGKSAVFFSATLLPSAYYRNVLGGEADDRFLVLQSPFSEKNRELVVLGGISLRYKEREKNADKVCECIKVSVESRMGNYMVFFPSYEYMNTIYDKIQGKVNAQILIQSQSMDEEKRDEFLEKFKINPKSSCVGFCVLGGIFSEGIDLISDRLIGAVIIGTGIPKLSKERDFLKEYYDKKCKMGFKYAYMYPGFNKVLQAAGRVIRLENDRGIIVLVDDRFRYSSYQNIFPNEWRRHKTLMDIGSLSVLLRKFWNT